MFKLKLGLQLYLKRIGLNFLILLNLFIIIFAVNSVVLLHNANVKTQQLTKNIANENIINTTNTYVSLEKLNAIRGFVKAYNYNYREISDSHDETKTKYYSRISDADFLAKFNYKPKKGRWFNAEDVNTNNVVLSYTTKYKVGDTVDTVFYGNPMTISLKVVGILAPNEYLFSQNAFYGGTWEGNFLKRDEEDSIIFYADHTYIVNQGFEFGENRSGVSVFLQFDNNMPKKDIERIARKLKADAPGSYVSTDTMAVMTKDYQNSANTLFVPVVIIIVLLGFATFITMSYINIRGLKREYVILQSLGAKKRDLLTILSVSMLIPFVLMSIFIFSFSFFSLLPITYYPSVTNALNYVVSFSILLFYIGLNMLFLCLMILRNKGFKEVVNEVE